MELEPLPLYTKNNNINFFKNDFVKQRRVAVKYLIYTRRKNVY